MWAPAGPGGAYLHHGLGVQSEVEVAEDKVGRFLESLVNDPGRGEGDVLLSVFKPTDQPPELGHRPPSSTLPTRVFYRFPGKGLYPDTEQRPWPHASTRQRAQGSLQHACAAHVFSSNGQGCVKPRLEGNCSLRRGEARTRRGGPGAGAVGDRGP